MLTDIARRPSPASFALRFAAWSIGLFGVLRLSWVTSHLVSPFTDVQARLAVALVGNPSSPISTTLECSGTDALALCMGAILAYPTRWSRKLVGIGVGLVLITSLNIVRIGTLGRVAASPTLFNLLHVYIWPLILTMAIGGFLLVWMRKSDLTDVKEMRAAALPLSPRARVFVALTAVLMVLFVISAPLYMESRVVLSLAAFMARAGARLLTSLGIEASAIDNILLTPRGALLVTQECITTPLIPVYLAAIWAFAAGWRSRLLGFAATIPLFVALGIVRLLVVALPSAVVSSPVFAIHAFYQLLLGAVVVCTLAVWRHGRARAMRPALVGLAVGAAFMWAVGSLYTQAIASPSSLPVNDPQGAIVFLPSFQTGLYLAMWIAAFVNTRWPLALTGLAVLALTQVIGLVLLQNLSHAGTALGVVDVRAWAVAAPLLIFVLVRLVSRPSPTPSRAHT